jgi:hypothetical protein
MVLTRSIEDNVERMVLEELSQIIMKSQTSFFGRGLARLRTHGIDPVDTWLIEILPG